MTDKPKKPRRTRVDSQAGVAAAMVAGGKKITLPVGLTLTAAERRVFVELCEEHSKSELTSHRIRLLVSLARNLIALDNEQKAIVREGSVLVNSHGNAYPNPRVKVTTGLHNSILSMRRSLGIHTRALEGGSNQKAAVRRAHNKANEADRANYDSNLINFPKPQEPHDDY
ncbi:hypothetical protein [Qipengyuania nanhaisediminis]|uniref:Phage terminase, small subunit, putative, P27 family n=1 Tax=Qipengyuania nanhaisediminis TaxID=604088 RepID=A0A1I5KA76_9SPHN|nr:hypothetical protein [Qipengyuania nanhaisediminis]SFO81930.1 hypothetical protein SAMN04488060_0038 [Qipengyuania nanhaisediminis]